MATEKKIIISSSNASGLIELYDTYKSQSGNELASYEDFITFLLIDSPDRSIFYDTYCNWEAVDMSATIVIKVDPK